MTNDQLRALWLVVGASGGIAGIAGIAIMIWLQRDAARFVWAVKSVLRPGLFAHLQHAQSDEREQSVLLCGVIVGALAILAHFCAGAAAVLGIAGAAIILIVLGEILQALSVALMVVLGLVKLSHRRRLFSVVQTKPKSE